MEAMKVTRLSVAEAQTLASEVGIIRYSRYLGAGYKDKYLDSFPLVDGRYAYYIEDPESGERYYQVFEDIPEDVMKELGECDRKRKLLERYEVEHKDKASIDGAVYEEVDDEEVLSPFDRKEYDAWFREIMQPDVDEEAEQDPKKEIVRMILLNLQENDQVVFYFVYNTEMTKDEVMDELNIPTADAYYQRVSRLNKKFADVFTALGYETLSAEKIEEELNKLLTR